tara:strand:+ start:1306 stop:1428 length:123 start_codon:yes stop_codon:yes gene_type:complete
MTAVAASMVLSFMPGMVVPMHDPHSWRDVAVVLPRDAGGA